MVYRIIRKLLCWIGREPVTADKLDYHQPENLSVNGPRVGDKVIGLDGKMYRCVGFESYHPSHGNYVWEEGDEC